MKKQQTRFLILVAVLILLWFAGNFFHIDTGRIEDFLKKFPLIFSAPFFIILYCVITFFIWLSKDFFKIIAALFFGAYLSTPLILIAEIINAVILFNLSRSLGRSFIENSLQGKFGSLDKKIAKMNFFWLVMFRLAPLVPFRFLDLAAGLTSISFKKYISAVILGSPLRIFWVQYIIAGVGENILGNPAALTAYLQLNKPLCIISFVYLISIIVVMMKMKFKD
ncbi:MAG: VTT domain-containing protein [Candidatus Omnitrophica bacterium]|jgi:uncharacterized membrane protein YdjX (TVP38/TMEM64 family)|nr:VTT domain-containing protein [Candidatus Omnitrophota bacterium]